MNNENLLNGASLACSIFTGISAGYYVYKATNEKADELVCNGGVVNAFFIGAGQMALAVGAGVATCMVMRHFAK